MKVEQSIGYFHQCMVLRVGDGAHNRAALEALREKAEREKPQPLTMQELKERHDKPIYVQDLEEQRWSGWRIVFWDRGKYFALQGISQNGYMLDEYGASWLAYDHEPKEAR